MEQTFSCIVCGKEFKPYQLSHKYCSLRCKNRADKNDRRFGGVRDYVLERDGFKCQKCGAQSQLIVHHKNWVRTENDPSNLITLCRGCHKKEHFEVTDDNESKKCFICGMEFHPLPSKRKVQVLCRRRVCKARYKVLQKRLTHEEVACIICGNTFMQKHPRHFCCGGECTILYNDRKKAERYANKREELKAKQIRYYQENKEVRKAYIRQWQAENPEKVKAYKLKNALKRKPLLPPSLSG